MLLIHCRLSSSGDEDCWVVEMKNDGNERHRVKTDQQFDRRENCDIVFWVDRSLQVMLTLDHTNCPPPLHLLSILECH